MKIAFTILILLLLYIFLSLGIFWYKSSHLPNLPVPDQSEKILGSGPALKYIAAGDSTAAGVGASSLQTTYTYQVAQALAKNHTVDYKNIGVPGAKTADVLASQISQIIAFKPDVVTISIGPNDATHLLPESEILNNYKNIISQLEAQTTATIYITDIANFKSASLLPWFYIWLLDFRSGYINKQILALGNNRVKIIDIYSFGWSNYPDLSKTVTADHFHPNDLGYQNWTNAFLDKF
jgi:lysophospholipase L1-like esterase